MQSSAHVPLRRDGTTAVHSLERFVFSVPDLDQAANFYGAFGLDVRHVGGRLDLHTFGHPHRWGSIYRGHGPKRIEYLSFAAYPEDLDALTARIDRGGISRADPHRLADTAGVWLRDPDGTAVQIVAAP